MRPLVLKLTLGFLFIGIIGAVLVALITSYWTRQAFGLFVNNRDQEQVATVLALYYAEAGSWEDVSNFITTNPYLKNHHMGIVLLDGDQEVVLASPGANTRPNQHMLAMEVAGKTVGYLSLQGGGEPMGGGWGNNGRFSPDTLFLRNVTLAAILSATIAGLIALVVGILLARNLTQPIQALTAATQAMAAGQLGQQVTVNSRDEIGQLATSFNQMSQDLAQASQMRKQMTADIAHDLRTPLTILRGYTEGLKDGALNSSPELYDIMYEEVVLLQHLVEDLRTLSLADAGELTLNTRAVDPKALLERTGLAYVMEAEQRGLDLHIEAADNLPAVHVDAERMTQVFNNLVSNALRFTSQGGIVLAAQAAKGQVSFEVRDSGTGIPAEELAHVFDRFYRADQSRQRTEDGSSGLGLAIARAIVEAHGGQITAVSTQGQGTTFKIQLPTHKPETAP